MADALFRIVFQNLNTFVQNELATFWGVDSQVRKLTGYLSAIDAVLQDADQKQIKSHAVKLWLQKLTDAAHVLDDILDQCSIQLGSQNSGFAAHTACLSPLHPRNILFRYDMGKRMKEVTERFHAINEERQMFELRSAGIITETQAEDDEWRQTSSVIIEPIVYGRDQDRELIVDFLLKHASENEDLSIYAVVGMGGLGKTTLAQLVFNDNRVITHFDLRIWVCISDDFTIMRVLRSILESTTTQNLNHLSLESLQKMVQEVLKSKKYLLVLDDVWDEDQVKWNMLKPLLQCGSGTKGTSILVTTRLENVASFMGTYPPHHLFGLSEDDNWSLFKHHAFGSNSEEREDLVAIGKEIVIKCVGSPLASKVLGSLLCSKREEIQWLRVKESEFWDIHEDNHIMPRDNHIMRALRLSYFNLKLSLRRCFSFCAIFPKDEVIVKEQLIHLWMANGFIQPRGNLEVEDVGNEVWGELYQRSFFQEVKIDKLGGITFKMHDLFHDLAQSIMGEECMVFEDASFTNLLPRRVHHLLCSDSDIPIKMAAFKKVESLRTFLEIRNLCPLQGTFRQLPSKSLVRALRIRVRQVTSLVNLTHLRYLNIYQSDIITLPESICRLQKLQILKLESCDYLYCLPKHLTRLKDLRHLVIKECNSLIVMPPYIRKLTCLKTLSTFIVDSKPGYGLAELRYLQLGGKLHISGLEKVNSECDAKQANLIGKKDLNRLYLSWDRNATSQCIDAERVLEALHPPCNLKSLGLYGYPGIQFSSWMRNPSVLKGLVHVILHNCTNCEWLPPLGKLPHLTTLDVYGMKDVRHIDDDSYDHHLLLKAFQSLKELTIKKLPNLERILREEGVELLPLLSKLRISGAPKLKLPHLPSVKYLEVRDTTCLASFPEGIRRNMPRLNTLSIACFIEMKVIPDEIGCLNALKELQVRNCHELESFPEHVLQGLTSLRALELRNCGNLKSLSKGVGHLYCLEHLKIYECPKLVSLPSNMNQLTALRWVSIDGCHQLPEGLERIPFLKKLDLYSYSADMLPEWLGDMTSLQEISIGGCDELRSLPSSFPQLTNLQNLDISYCPKLGSLPSGFSQLTNLKELHIDRCPKIEKRCKRGTGEDWQKIAHVPLFKIACHVEKTYCEKIRFKWNKGKRNIQEWKNKVQRDYLHWKFTNKIDEIDRL